MSKFVLVEALAQYRMRYVVEVPDDHNDGEFPCTAEQWAADTVTVEEAKEFSQLWLGETVISTHEVSKEQIMDLIEVDNEYCKAWSDEHKFNTFVTPIGYKRDW